METGQGVRWGTPAGEKHDQCDPAPAWTVEETPTAEPLAAPWGSTGRDRSTEPGVADDFKGQFKTHNGVYCYPLTVTDHYSRSLLLCHGLPSVKGDGVKPLLEKLFRELGLPEVIRTDNGSPFASTGIHGLCALNVWWMHRDLKRETARPPYANMQAQQVAFDELRHRFNNGRPHEALDGTVPSDLWRPSPRPMVELIKLPEYPGHFEVRKVGHCGAIRLACHQRFVSNALKDEYVGLEEVDDGIWNIVYYTTLLGRIDERDGRITGVQSDKKVPGLLLRTSPTGLPNSHLC